MAPDARRSRQMKNLVLLGLAVVLAAMPQASASPLDALGVPKGVEVEVPLPAIGIPPWIQLPPVGDICVSETTCLNPAPCVDLMPNAQPYVDQSFLIYVEYGWGGEGVRAGYSESCNNRGP